MDAHELARWTRFAAKGGIGKCTAIVDCIAQEMGEDLMFLKDDEITVLMQLPEAGFYLGHCEGVVGRFSVKDVRFHGKLKKPVMAKRSSVPAGTEGKTAGEGARHVSESSPSNSRPGSRAKQTPSPAHAKSHAPTQSYSTSYSHSSEDHTVLDSRSTTIVGHSLKDAGKSGHAKSPQMATSVSGASIYSVGSVYSEASTATSVYSALDDPTGGTQSRNGSIYSVKSDETEKDVPGDTEYGTIVQANGSSEVHTSASASVSMSDTRPSTPSASTSNATFLASGSASSSVSASTSTSSTSFTSASTYGPDSVMGSLGSVGSITELEAKQFDMNKLGVNAEMQTGFTLVPPPLTLGGGRGTPASPVVAPLRVSKPPRLTPSPGLSPTSPLSVRPGDSTRSTPVSPAFPSTLSPGIPTSLLSRPPPPSSPLGPGHPGALSPGLPGSLAPGPRSPGVPGSLSPGFRSPAFSHAQSQYAFLSGGSSANSSPNPHESHASPHESPCLPSSHPSTPRINEHHVPTTTPKMRSSSVSSPFSLGQPYSGPLSPPPSSPLPPLPATSSSSLPSPAFPTSPLPVPGSIGAAATAAAGGRVSPLAVLSSSLPSPMHVHVDDRGGRRDDASGDEMEEEGNTTRLSTLDAFRRRLDDSADETDEEVGYGGHSEAGEEEEEGVLGPGNEERAAEDKDEADAHSDGEVGIGLSLMGALGEDEDDEDVGTGKTNGGDDGEGSDEGVGVNRKTAGENGSATPMAWTRYSPTSPITAQDPNGHRRAEEKEEEDEDEEKEDEDEDDGGYWDEIYDDYRYSRYSLASKRFSVTSKRMSIMSKGSGASKTRENVPPMPATLDRPSVDTSRPSFSSDGTNGYPRPSVESVSSSLSTSMPFSRPSLSRTASDDSTHALPLTAQFPAVPVHVPVRTESRLRVVNDGYMQGDDDHGEKELQVEHGSTEESTSEVGLNIGVVEPPQDDGQGQEVEVDVAKLSANAALSPLLHTTFGSPHSSRFTDTEESSDQDHLRRYSNKSGKSNLSSPKSPMDAGMASALRERVLVEGAASSTIVPAPGLGSSSNMVPEVRADDKDAGINMTVMNESALATEATSRISPSAKQSSSVSQATVATDPTQAPQDQTEDAEKSTFLRPRPQPNHSPHPFARTSMFFPHPNAPKAVHQSQGPMYGRTAPQPYAYPGPTGAANAAHSPTPPGTTFYSSNILHQLRNISIAASQGSVRRPPMTLFARCQPDLGGSMGPVPILFSLDPFPPAAEGTGKGSGRVQTASTTPTRAATVSAPVRREGVPVNGGAGNASALRLPKRTVTAAGGAVGLQGDVPLSPSLPIPREGFVPRVGTARPRSRSFSAFGANAAAAPQERSREEPVMKMQDATAVTRPARKASLPPALMPRQTLAPLNLSGSPVGGGNLASPIVQSLSIHVKPPPSSFTPEPLTHSPQFVDATSLNGTLASPVVSSPLANGLDRNVSPASGPPGSTGRTSVSSSNPRSATSPMMPVRKGSFDVPPRTSPVEVPPRQSSDSGDSRTLASPPPIPETTSQRDRSSPLAQELTLKTKLSLPGLRIKAGVRSKLDDAVSVASLAVSGENEMVQVQDMDFELVKPSLPQVTGRASQDSTLTGREDDTARPDASPIPGDAASAVSHAPRSPLAPTTAPAESAESIDAHRQRELKWMALFPVVPPSQARKNKKVRKLLQEGVPSSVRYLVWCHLTDSKARALHGVYANLGKRPPVSAFAEIERDAAEGFPDQPQLHTARGPLVSLLQAYLSMVPDIQYDSGLTSIAGHLLLLAPEEDAFWIFASMMDAHLRTYFSTNTVQIEIDASLFSRALETIDPVLTKKLYVQLSISPASITRPWFSTLFVGSLSVDHLHRVWDIFLYDGIPYLFRVGLVLLNCVRHLLLQAETEEAALAHIARPPPACLPSANELLVLASNVKLKDDDVRKQRVKMEQQLKRTTQARPPNGMSSVQTSTISLPRT